jgi:hypothetical protein
MVQSVCDSCSVSMVQFLLWFSQCVKPVQFLLWFQWDDEGKAGRDTMSVGLDGLEIDRYSTVLYIMYCKVYLHTVKYCFLRTSCRKAHGSIFKLIGVKIYNDDISNYISTRLFPSLVTFFYFRCSITT